MLSIKNIFYHWVLMQLRMGESIIYLEVTGSNFQLLLTGNILSLRLAQTLMKIATFCDISSGSLLFAKVPIYGFLVL